jgi:dTDP-4-dehydrorhamnose reductase
MKILLTGAQGQVGWELARSLLPLGEMICANRSQADLLDLDALSAFIQLHRPDVIVNAAAYTAVDKAESESHLAFMINAKAPEVLAEEAKKRGALLIHYSTDYVFDGTKRNSYNEEDATNPINVYGQSKLAGEKAIQALDPDYLILRTSWVYASRGQNFLKTILRLAAEREQLNIVADQIGSPTWARLIADTTAHVIKQAKKERQHDQFKSAVFNLSSAGTTSWYDFAQQIINNARQQTNHDIKTRLIKPIPATDYPLPAKRPANSKLQCDKLEQHFGLSMPTWESSVKLCMAEMPEFQ